MPSSSSPPAPPPPSPPPRTLTGIAASEAISKAAGAHPAILVLDSVACLPDGIVSNVMLLTNMPTMMTARSIGSLLALHGRVRVNLALTRRHGLVAVLDFERTGNAHNAFEAINGMRIEVGPADRGPMKSAAAVSYTLRPLFARTPLLLRPMPIREAKQVESERLESRKELELLAAAAAPLVVQADSSFK